VIVSAMRVPLYYIILASSQLVDTETYLEQ